MNKTKIITFANQKGGVGKTTSCLSVGACLESMGYKVLYIDTDKQCNTSAVLNANLNGKSIYNILGEQEQAQACIQINAKEQHVIPSSEKLSIIESLIGNKMGKEYRLKESLESVQGFYDFILIDTAPSLDITTINALTITDYLVIICGADIFSLSGLKDLIAIVKGVKQYTNANLNIGGILINRYNKRSRLNQDLKEELEAIAASYNSKVFNAYIRECISLKECQLLGERITEYAPKSNAAVDFMQLTREILKDIVNNKGV